MARRNANQTNTKLIRIPEDTYERIVQAADRERRTLGAQVAVMVERAENYAAAITGAEAE